MSTDPDRDPALAALWREHSTETPSPRVDAAILAAAHSAAASGSNTGSRSPAARAWRWWVPLAAAALVAVVVVGVKPPSETMVDDAAPSATDMPHVVPAPEIAPATPGSIAPRQMPKLEAERAQRFAAPPPAGAAEMMAAPARPALPDARADAGTALSADDWIARIRALRERGAQDDALRELARFRDAFADADARLPADLHAWAKRLPR